MTREEQAVQCRRGLESSLRSVHEFTTSATTAAGQLLHHMNAVLSSVVGSNFGSESYNSIGELYESIAREKLGMLDRCEDVPFLFFARSFAVVIEEAVRQLREANATTVPSSLRNTASEASWSGSKEEERKPVTPPVVAVTAAEPKATAVAAAATTKMRHKWETQELDFSDKTMEGPIHDYITHGSKAKQLVFAKLESNQAADEAVARLNGIVLHGRSITVKRDFSPNCSKDATATNDLTVNDEMAFCAAFAAAAKAAEDVADAGVEPEREEILDSDDEIMRDDVSNVYGKCDHCSWTVQRKYPYKKLHFSQAAIEGRLLEFYYPRAAAGKTRRYAHAKLESNQAADEAVTRLSGAQRALYWGESWPATPRPVQQVQQHPRPVLDWFQVRVVPAAEVACINNANAVPKMTPPEPVLPEDVAAVCRAKLRQSLLVTSQLLRMEATPAEALLARMNDLLAGAVDSNFGSSSHEQVRALYSAIARLQPQLIDHCEHLSLLYLARSLAVVIEEAVRQKEQKLPEAPGKKEELSGAAIEGYGSEQKNEEEYGSCKIDRTEKVEEGKSTVAAEYGSYTGKLFGSDKIVEKTDEFPLDSFEPAAAAEKEQLPALPVEVETMKKEEMIGVLTIHGVSPYIRGEQLRSFLEVFGTLKELRHYPKCKGWMTGFAVCRYESEEVAQAALARLNTKMFLGTELHVRSLAALAREDSSATEADPLRASPTNTDSSAPEEDRDATGADSDMVVGEDTVALDSDDTDTEAVLDDSWDSLDEVD
uniref:RNA binding protein n=1 Tax=Pristionchus pacificus TaxID=54126 RepID=A0A2A6BNZ2_PRIPA|eukprot:PDM67481.1 RNA binding protein [Pristionchus pacificus]